MRFVKVEGFTSHISSCIINFPYVSSILDLNKASLLHLMNLTRKICFMGKETSQLELQFYDDTYQLTGVAISKQGRLFTNYPLWPGPHKYALVEVLENNEVKPFPNEEMNTWKEGDDGKN